MGFTIVELLIVIVVIGILAAIVIVAYNGVTKRAQTSSLELDVAAMDKAQKSYITLNDSPPLTYDSNGDPNDLLVFSVNKGNSIVVRLKGTNEYCVYGYNPASTTLPPQLPSYGHQTRHLVMRWIIRHQQTKVASIQQFQLLVSALKRSIASTATILLQATSQTSASSSNRIAAMLINNNFIAATIPKQYISKSIKRTILSMCTRPYRTLLASLRVTQQNYHSVRSVRNTVSRQAILAMSQQA